MAIITSLSEVSLKSLSDVDEKVIQKYIHDNPQVLGLGDLEVLSSERIQPSGGRLDLLLGDDRKTRYELELQLGPTDESHIIRTIEYWDVERKRYPDYDHCAVIVAEEITTRFFNVISLFNGQIPLIALKLTGFRQTDGTLAITFTKILDRVRPGTPEEDTYEPADRSYWLKRSTSAMVELAEKMFDNLSISDKTYSLKYNKYYLGVSINGTVKNFITFRPKKSWVWFRIYVDSDETISKNLEEQGIEAEYYPSDKMYELKIHNIGEFHKAQQEIQQLYHASKKQHELI